MDDCSFGVILLRLSEEMYIQKAEITNIKSIEHFEIEFPNPAGWHVLIGDNGSGKSTIVRAMALALVGVDAAIGLRDDFGKWIKDKADKGVITLNIDSENNIENIHGIYIVRKGEGWEIGDGWKDVHFPLKSQVINTKDFSVGFGPYRRFEGGSSEWDEVYNIPTLANLAAHLSIFNESVALTEPIKWLKELDHESLRDKPESKRTLENLKRLINSEDFLPHNSKLEKIGSDGVFFKDGNGTTIAVNQMSDGYRSILSLTFELIRQLVRVYGSEKVFKNIEKGEMFIDLPGVVLVDEIDAHLHPTWQTRIGQWFLKYFPNLQFIVTTHSPLVCRACEKGSIWRLAAPGSDEESGEITGVERERLIYGDILDAIEVFGPDLSISKQSVKKQEELVKLSKKKMAGVSSRAENKTLEKLRNTFTTDDSIDL
jgi:predicted ATP-binding protein involved in virulence